MEPSYIQEGPPGKSLHVRAVQGHSIRSVDNEAVLEKVGEHENRTALIGTFTTASLTAVFLLAARVVADDTFILPQRCRRNGP